MSFFDKIFAKFAKPTTTNIRIVCEVVEGGYIRVNSEDLKGFRLMLEPSALKDVATLRASIEAPLVRFASIYYAAKAEARRHRENSEKVEENRFKVIDFSRGSGSVYNATLSGGLNHC